MSLGDTLDFKKAFSRVMQDKHDDTWPDVVGYRDYKRILDENLESQFASLISSS